MCTDANREDTSSIWEHRTSPDQALVLLFQAVVGISMIVAVIFSAITMDRMVVRAAANRPLAVPVTKTK